MKFYYFTYANEASPAGFSTEYFRNKEDLRKGLAALRRQHLQDTKEAKARQEAGELYAAFPTYEPRPAFPPKQIEFHGTAKQMVFAALKFAEGL